MPNEQPNDRRPRAADIPGQKLPYPARQADMRPEPASDLRDYRPAGKLAGKVALVTSGDSGIGRAVAVAFAMEGADVAILYNVNDGEADVTRARVEARGRRCLVLKADVRESAACREAVARTVRELGGLNVLVNNAAYQLAQRRFEDVTEEQWDRTFRTNIYATKRSTSAWTTHS